MLKFDSLWLKCLIYFIQFIFLRLLGIAANEYMDATLGHKVTDLGVAKLTLFVNPTVGLDVCFEATMVMIIAGTIAGLIPAFKASRIRPIEALRAD